MLEVLFGLDCNDPVRESKNLTDLGKEPEILLICMSRERLLLSREEIVRGRARDISLLVESDTFRGFEYNFLDNLSIPDFG